MSVLTLDARAHAEVVKAAVSTALGQWDAYDFDEAPGSNGNTGKLPNLFALVSVDMVPSVAPRMSARSGTTQWIISVRGVGRTIDEARWVLWKAATALQEKALTVSGRATTPLQLQPGQAPEKDDDGRYSGLSVYSYAH